MEYRGFLFTKHALERADLRSISKDSIISVLEHPDETRPSDKPGTVKFVRHLHGRVLHVVASYQAPQKKWLIISVWVRGEDDPVPLVWLILTAPFKLLLWLLRKIWSKN